MLYLVVKCVQKTKIFAARQPEETEKVQCMCGCWLQVHRILNGLVLLLLTYLGKEYTLFIYQNVKLDSETWSSLVSEDV